MISFVHSWTVYPQTAWKHASRCLPKLCPFPVTTKKIILSITPLIPPKKWWTYFLGNNTSSKCFHMTENRIPCNPLANIFVSNPRNINPWIPLSLITFLTTWGYDNSTSELCLYTFTTRIEFEHVSLTAEEQNPSTARRPNSFNGSSCFGIFSDRRLYVKNHG